MVIRTSTSISNAIVCLDSVAHAAGNHHNSVIVCGSHGGKSAAKHLLQFMPSGAIFNDAGKGKDNAGITGLELFQAHFVPAAAVDNFSAKIGDGEDTYESGCISAINDEASKCGITIGMQVKEAAMKMLLASG